jgi:hypothetical protein
MTSGMKYRDNCFMLNRFRIQKWYAVGPDAGNKDEQMIMSGQWMAAGLR